MIGAMVTGIAMMTAVLWMPASLGALAQTYGLDPTALSHLAFAELSGFLLGTLFVSNRTFAQLRRWVPVGCALIVVGSAWFILRTDHPPAGWSRLVSGFGSGIGFGYGLKTCAASAKQTRNFGILTAAMSLVMVIGFQFVAYLTESLSAANSGASRFPWLVCRHACSARTRRSRCSQRSSSCSIARRRSAARSAVISSARCAGDDCADRTALRSHWPSSARAASGRSCRCWACRMVSASARSQTQCPLSRSSGSPAAWLPRRVPRGGHARSAIARRTDRVSGSGSTRCTRLLRFAWYVAGCAVGGFYWNFTLPLILGLLARLDDTGRGAVLGGTMSSLGGQRSVRCSPAC